jgi:hypothetical protein
MSRKSIIWTIVILLLLLGGASATLILLVRHEPEFYVRAAVPPGEQRKRSSGDFVLEFTHLIEGVLNKRQWDIRFTQDQINSYFEEDFVKEHTTENPLPEGISEPRISLEADRIRLAFRYGSGWLSTVISIDMRAWRVVTQPNVLALEFQALHAGALPISAQSLLERVYEAARQQNIDPTWYRFNGHPVLLLRFQADRNNPTFQLQELELHPSMLRITGRSFDTTAQAR